MTDKVLKKITARTVGIPKGAQGLGYSMVVMGRVTKAATKSTDYGEYVEFQGQFLAFNEYTGERFRGNKFIAPGGMMENDLALTLADVQENEGKNAYIEFGARFSLIENKEAATGCEWSAESLQQPSEDDPLERLAAGMADKIKGLPKPDAKAQQDAAPKAGDKTNLKPADKPRENKGQDKAEAKAT
jgi:hypothetical protein